MISALDLPVTLRARTGMFDLRRASGADLGALMLVLADDPISAARGDTADVVDAELYRAAVAAIVDDPSNELLVMIGEQGEPLATMQLTRIPGLARRGSTRLLLEAVRVRGDHRSSGVGTAMMRWVLDVAAPAVGASLVQLTSDETRHDAHRFYESLGFVGSHRGFKDAVW